MPAKAIRWEERLVAVLGAAVTASPERGAFEPAAVMPELIEKVTSFGARIEQFTPSALVAVFGIDPMEDAARRAVLAAQAMLQAVRRDADDKRGRFAVHVGSYLIARTGAVTGMDAEARRHATDVVSGLLEQAAPVKSSWTPPPRASSSATSRWRPSGIVPGAPLAWWGASGRDSRSDGR